MPLPRTLALVLGLVVVALPALACSGRLAGRALPTSGSTSGTLPVGPASATAPIEPGVKPNGTTFDRTLRTTDGRTRSYHLFVPGSVGQAAGTDSTALRASGRPVHHVPLLVALHGGMGSGDQFAHNSGFDQLAEANGFLVVYPDGVGTGPRGRLFRTWNGGNCCGPAQKQDVDDVAFIRQLIDEVSAAYPVDARRVFAAGHSNGGILAYRLACELSDRIAAIGVQSTSLGVAPCHPAHPVSVIHIHGTADKNIPIDGGKGPHAVSGVSFRPPLEGVRTLAAADGCAATPATSVDPANADVTIERWTSCHPGIDVELVKVAGASHAWMGHDGSRLEVAGPPYRKLDSSAVIWSFLVAHPKA